MRRLIAAVGVFVTVVALSACSPVAPHGDATLRAPLPELSQLVPLDNPRAWQGPSTAVIDDVSVTALVDPPEPALPVTVDSVELTGPQPVTITDTSRVLAIDRAGSLAATTWALGQGDTLVGRDAATTFPGTENLPVVTGSGHTVNAESIIALKPTLILTDGSIGPRDVVEQLRDVGITVVFVANDPSFAGASALARDVGAALGVPQAGAELASQIADQIDAARDEIRAFAPQESGEQLRMLFLYVRGSAGVYYLFGEESGADALIDALGGVDIAQEQGWAGMQPMTDEAMAAANPDLILVMTGGIDSAGGVTELINEKPAIGLTRAGQNRRFVDMDDTQVLSFGPRSADVLRALARAIYAPNLQEKQ